MVEGLKDTEKIEALKAQLRFREQVLEQEAEDQLFRFSRKNETGGRTNLSLEELLKNMFTLIENSLSLEDSGEKTIASLIGKRVQHEFNEDGKNVLYLGKIISTVPGYPSWVNIKYDNDDSIYQCFLQTFKKTAENFAGVEGAAKPPAGLRDSVPIGVTWVLGIITH